MREVPSWPAAVASFWWVIFPLDEKVTCGPESEPSPVPGLFEPVFGAHTDCTGAKA